MSSFCQNKVSTSFPEYEKAEVHSHNLCSKSNSMEEVQPQVSSSFYICSYFCHRSTCTQACMYAACIIGDDAICRRVGASLALGGSKLPGVRPRPPHHSSSKGKFSILLLIHASKNQCCLLGNRGDARQAQGDKHRQNMELAHPFVLSSV